MTDDRTRSTDRASPLRSAPRVRRLTVAFGQSAGSVLLLEQGSYVLGRATFPLDDPEASKHHANVEQRDGRWVLEDAGSRNGTFVNGARTTGPVVLSHGAVIRMGGSLLVFDDLEVRGDADAEDEFLPGPSLGLSAVRAEIRLVAPQPIPVLILGESGTGKELVAEQIHRKSGRKGAFVPLNCAAIAPELAESELFGHVKGAFTGAGDRSEGLFFAADKGTLFLDEIGELPLGLQPKLLRALARGEVRPVGSTETKRADVRIVAATHRDLVEAAQKTEFRGDLLARLSGWTIKIPPLRERKLDILPLANLFLKKRTEISPDAAEALLLHNYPFNVRELEQTIAAAAVRAGKSRLDPPHLPPAYTKPLESRFGPSQAPASPPLEWRIPKDRPPTKEDLAAVFTETNGSVAEAAEFFGKDRKQIYRWAEKLGLDPDSFRKT